MKKLTTTILLFLLASFDINISAMIKVPEEDLMSVDSPIVVPKESSIRRFLKAIKIISCISKCDKYCCDGPQSYNKSGKEPLAEFEKCFLECEECYSNFCCRNVSSCLFETSKNTCIWIVDCLTSLCKKSRHQHCNRHQHCKMN